MKGVIADCLSELVIDNFGRDKWEEILTQAGLDKNTTFAVYSDLEDATVMQVINITCEVLSISMEQAADAFGDYWVNIYAPGIYWAYYSNVKSARDFLLNMDHVHERTTQRVPNAHPPRFEYEWRDGNTLIMHYHSGRGLIDILIGLIKGVGKHYHEKLDVTKINDKAVKIVFTS